MSGCGTGRVWRQLNFARRPLQGDCDAAPLNFSRSQRMFRLKSVPAYAVHCRRTVVRRLRPSCRRKALRIARCRQCIRWSLVALLHKARADLRIRQADSRAFFGICTRVVGTAIGVVGLLADRFRRTSRLPVRHGTTVVSRECSRSCAAGVTKGRFRLSGPTMFGASMRRLVTAPRCRAPWSRSLGCSESLQQVEACKDSGDHRRPEQLGSQRPEVLGLEAARRGRLRRAFFCRSLRRPGAELEEFEQPHSGLLTDRSTRSRRPDVPVDRRASDPSRRCQRRGTGSAASRAGPTRSRNRPWATHRR